ncbi:type III-B CRISPR module-associated Cmr3 family protein [Marinomonas mediterranea]|jgi:CRISPR-associated protein (Cas_Cmr3).|uniref:CRISPR-associated protein, Cmr3 n=1 Tax=Marinomonas mediterranea (strain ATCC 700492 / JCM 21426 / NBRC 103028 / MMB-1) TaxID=717774 RepID=F2K1W5_MARM1|nr:type III-B CRISPR module-associated Cmr3 family protein [Marinomonas mediterranea]ADZ89959.1 CRISPR-associated protein, Cmr3 [Marinomonas mediterranea MMB-1]WCN16168.1 CRISPR-associated protein Cmr3 [Marinomonas mediterranea MMB-1]
MHTHDQKENTYLLDPKAPLIIRSGRPFDEQAGADDARFPPPSTMAGALRAAYARANNIGFNKENTQDILSKAIKGPLPVKQSTEEDIKTLLVPKPEDAQYYYDQAGNIEIVRLSPRELDENEGWDLPRRLLPVSYHDDQEKRHGKPAKGAQWWSLKDLLEWRLHKPINYKEVHKNGWIPPADDIRTHVAINPQSFAAEDGQLFQTSGLPMWQVKKENQSAFPDEKILLAGCINGDLFPEAHSKNDTPQSLNIGGERRLAEILTEDQLWPQPDEQILRDILEGEALSLTLLTPAIFKDGWLPCQQDENGHFIYRPPNTNTLELELVSAAIGRWTAQSGWDLAKHQPKPSRKLVPAGAVYWFRVREGNKHDLEQLWFSNISTKEQDRKDGFGLVLPHSTTLSASGAK